MKELARALFGFIGTESGDLTFDEGEIIEVLDKSGDWWRGKTTDGKIGYFPYNRVEIVKQKKVKNGSDDLMDSLRNRNSSEKIKKVSVDLKEFKKNKRSNAVFEIEITLDDGKKPKFEKSMPDFRKLDKAIQLLDPGYEYVHTLPPEWADELPLSTNQAKSRARALTKYLANNTNERELFDMVILSWANSSKSALKREKVNIRDAKLELKTGDSKGAISEKVQNALASSYQDKGLNAVDMFENGGNNSEPLGKLARVVYDWDQRDDMEINLVQYEYVLVLQEKTKYDGWWYGQKASGKKGLFPYNYVKILASDDVRTIFKPNKTKNIRNAGQGSTVTVNTNFTNQVTDTPNSKQNKYQPTPPKKTTIGKPNQQEVSFENLGMLNNLAYKKQTANNNAYYDGPMRNRKIEEGYCLKSVDAFDELKTRGVTIETLGKMLKWKRNPKNVKKGDQVLLDFSAYVWNPQTQQLIEFSSSEKLNPPPKGVEQGVAGDSGKQMEFVIGQDESIDGLEEAVKQMEPNQKYRVTIAPKKGYGDVGSPPEIPGECFLVYDLILKNIVPKGSVMPSRKAIFSVGYSKLPNVTNRPIRGSFKEYKGFKSINNKKNLNGGDDVSPYKQEFLKKMAGSSSNVRGNNDAYKGKMTLKQLQEIVRKNQFDEYGIVQSRPEEYLSDSEFLAAFKMRPKEFLMLSTFQKKIKRREAGLLM